MRKLGLSVLVLVVAIGGYLGYLLTITGQFKTITNQFAGTCTPVTGAAGAEDIAIDRATGQAFIAAIDRRGLAAGTGPKGAIWGYDLTADTPTLVNLTARLSFAFSTHGIGLWTDDAGATLLAVNHGQGGVFAAERDSIEVFDVKEGALVHRTTIKSTMLQAINDVVPVGGGRFYATRDHRFTDGILRTLEDYGRLALASVLYYDGETFTTVASGFRYANGINVSADGSKIYVAATTDGEFSVFDRDRVSGALSNQRVVDLNTGVDNIDVDADGALWIAGHPKLLDFVAHSKDAGKLSASQVLKLTPRGDGGFDVKEIYLNDGTELSGSSVAATYGNRMLIGPVLDPNFLDCTMGGEG